MRSSDRTELGPDPRLQRARVIARALDSAVGIPGTKIRLGADALLGLIPGLGDAAGAAFSAYLVLLGSQLGLSKAALLQMVANVAIDTVVGTVPVLGDLFDIGWKSNMRNLSLLEKATGAAPAKRASRNQVALAVIVILVLLIATIAFATWVVTQLWTALRG